MTPLAARVLLAILSVQSLVLGVWATLSPTSFFEEFPGFGRQWVLPDGPYNEHLVRDFGALNLALAAVTLIALVTLERRTVLVAAVAWIVWSVPHVVDHLRRRDVLDPADRVSAIGGLVLTLLLAIVLAAVPVRRRDHAAVS